MPNRILRVCVVTGLLLLGLPVAAQSPRPDAAGNVKENPKAGSEQFQARVDEAARILEKAPRYKSLSPQQRKELVEFVAGNMLFALTHEFGHAIIAEMDVPILGREEDAADAFAVVTMLDVGTELSDRVLSDAATGWFRTDRRSRAQGLEMRFYNEHGLERQRAYQIVCLMIGSDPDRFAQVAEKVELPERRRQTCQKDYRRASRSWDRVLELHARPADQPKQKIEITYGPGPERLDTVAEAIRTIGLLETVTNAAAQRYRWPRPIKIEMMTCGCSDAYWSPSTQTISMCYEFAQDFAELYRDFGAERTAKSNRKKK